MTISRSLILFLCAFTMSVSVAGDDMDKAAVEQILEQFPELDDGDIRPTPVPDLYEIRLGAQISYITADGRYLLQGDLYDAEEEINLTETRREGARAAAVNDVSESSMIIFGPADAKRTVTVFTDIDCGYCRKLHRQIEAYNELGIRVRYLFFPRSGPETTSWFKAETVWCADDRNAALTQAKAGTEMEIVECESTPIEQHYRLGRSFGIQGTPAIIADTGEMIGGYLPPDALLKELED